MESNKANAYLSPTKYIWVTFTFTSVFFRKSSLTTTVRSNPHNWCSRWCLSRPLKKHISIPCVWSRDQLHWCCRRDTERNHLQCWRHLCQRRSDWCKLKQVESHLQRKTWRFFPFFPKVYVCVCVGGGGGGGGGIYKEYCGECCGDGDETSLRQASVSAEVLIRI